MGERRGLRALAAQLRAEFFAVNLLTVIASAGCHDDPYELEREHASSNANAGDGGDAGPSDGGSNRGSSSATGKDGGGTSATDGGRSDGGGGASSSSTGSTDAGGAASGGDSGTGAIQGAVVAACMGHGGETVCDGATMIRCGAGANAESQMTCGSEARCRAGLAAGKCGECDPGTAMCMGAMLRECDTNGVYSKVTPCPSEALCSEKNKSCNPSQCGVDAYTCEAGFLKKCKPDQTGFDMGMQCKSQDLCSSNDKRCNECLPNSKVCDQDTLMVCSADGKGPMATPCSGTTPKCNKDKCVQCKAPADCTMTPPDCRVPSCNAGTGMCGFDVAGTGTKCANGTKVCLLGSCVDCLDDSNCSASQRCSLLNQCVDRAPLTVSASFLLGTCSLTLNANYNLLMASSPAPSGTNAVTVTGSEGFLSRGFTVTMSTSSTERLVTAGSAARTFTMGGSTTAASATCSVSAATDSMATFTFTAGSDSLTFAVRANR